MAFVVKILFLCGLVYVRAEPGYPHHHHGGDSYISSAANAPSASYGPPSSAYGPPPITGSLNLDDYSHGSHSGGLLDHSHSHDGYQNGGYSEGSLLLDSNLPPKNGADSLGPPRVIGTTVSVGRPNVGASQYELKSVVQDVVRKVPIEVVRHIQIAVPQPVPVPVRQEIKVPVPQPYPVHVNVEKKVPYPVYKTQQVEVERPVPYEVIRKVPVEVIKKVHVPVDKPYDVIKKVHVPIEKHVEVPHVVWKPYPLHIIKHVTHYKKKKCCW